MTEKVWEPFRRVNEVIFIGDESVIYADRFAKDTVKHMNTIIRRVALPKSEAVPRDWLEDAVDALGTLLDRKDIQWPSKHSCRATFERLRSALEAK